MFDIGMFYFRYSNFLEMRRADLIKVNDELFEIVKRFPITKFSVEITGGNADFLREYYNVEKILRSSHTNEYLFVNSVPDIEFEDL